jgi:hypothetical protein
MSTGAARPPVVLDLDGSVRPLAGEQRFSLADWQEGIRFGCGLPRMQAFAQTLSARLPPFGEHGAVFLGSGDFHHLSWPLIERCIAARAFDAGRPLRIVVLDNHPDNMRFPFGVHCGSWVRRVALLPQVSQVHVAGITSGDIGWGHCWENYLAPLRAGKLSYWSIGVDTGWARWLGLGRAFRGFADADTLVAALCAHLAGDAQPTYLSIDKDAFASDVVHTNWDQGVLCQPHAAAVVDVLRGRIAGCDVTGDVSSYRYRTAWKRWLSAGDGQSTEIAAEVLGQWQEGQGGFDRWLLGTLQTRGDY